jgi:hypothetical protein
MDMTTQITEQQRLAIEQHQGGPVIVVDPANHKNYVLLPEDVYQRVRALLQDDSIDVRETYAAQERALGAAGWDDPTMDAYNDYDAHRQQP